LVQNKSNLYGTIQVHPFISTQLGEEILPDEEELYAVPLPFLQEEASS